MSNEVGLRLKAIRQKMGFSQRQLSKESGVANATISQIEAGLMNPTVSMLKKILDALPLSLSDFFSDSAEHEDKVFFSANELYEIGEGGVSYRQVGSNLRNRAIQLLYERYQPGAGTGKQSIQHAGEECGILLRGKLEVRVGDQVRILKAGEAYYFKSTQPHHFKNVGHEPCELISACTPPGF